MSKRQRNAWSVSALPGVLRANARVVEAAASAQESAATTLGDATRRLGLAAAYRHEAGLCRYGALPLYWVTADMAQVALDASQDMPVLSVDSAPTKCGFLAIAGGVPPLPPSTPAGWATLEGGRITDGITPSALLWETTATDFTLTIYAHESVRNATNGQTGTRPKSTPSPPKPTKNKRPNVWQSTNGWPRPPITSPTQRRPTNDPAPPERTPRP